MVCLCGRTISNNMNTLLNHSTRTLSFHNWERFPVQQLYNDISAYNTFRSMITSLCHPTANAAVDLLRCYFAGFLDEVKVANQEEENLADFLTAQGVLFRPNVSERKFHMASALIDGLIRTNRIPSKFPNAPSTALPFCEDMRSLHLLNVLIESLKFFDKELIRLASSRSYKSAKVTINGSSAVQVPRESVYDTELMRILSNWLGKYGWTVTSQWHLQTTHRKHKYTDIVLQNRDDSPLVLELLATGDPGFVKSHIEKTPEHMALLSADEAWVVHFTCQDDYHPTWQSDAELQSGVNVVHFVHNLGFTEVLMSARWRNGAGSIQQVDRQFLAV